ncbi:MAG: MFS transporter permease [Desulfobacterales bacterium]|jgi:hypothetical protein
MSPIKEIVISKDQAAFRLDGRGRWHNVHGPFQHAKIIAHFHRSIRRDAGGYYLYQDHGTHGEKVYFPYEDTALFVWDLELGPRIVLMLNTGRKMIMDPGNLTYRDDDLYYTEGDERIKFSERALLKLGPHLEESHGALSLSYQGKSYPILKLG